MAAQNRQTGMQGEALAAQWLEEQGYTLLHRNWRWKRYEIDLIAHRNGILHFIEVKTRRSAVFGHPEESVDTKKLEHVYAAAEQFLEDNPGWNRVQYDVFSILLKKNQPPEFFLLEDMSL